LSKHTSQVSSITIDGLMDWWIDWWIEDTVLTFTLHRSL
jgi:hypothetical protein